MQKGTFIIIIATLVFSLLLLMYLHKPSGHEQQLEKALRERTLFVADSLSVYYDSIINHKDAEFFQLFKKTKEESVRWESEAKESQRKLKIEIGKRRSFNDKQTDSLLNEVR